MQEQQQQGILPTIPKDDISDHETYTAKKKRVIIKIRKYTLSFPSSPTAHVKKPKPTF